MKRILFSLICAALPLMASQAHAAIQIYASGHEYDSFQSYEDSKKVIPAVPSEAIPASLDSQQQDYVSKEAKQLGIDVDPKKVKTFRIGRKGLTSDNLHKLYVLSVESGVVGALQDFYQTWGQSDFQMTRRISSEQLQEAIQQAMATSKDPKLLISEPGKVRIMVLTTKNISS